MSGRDIWAVVPMKDTRFSKQRLEEFLPPTLRQRLAIAMFCDVIDVLCEVRGLAGILVVTEDAEVATIASARRARVVTRGAAGGHTGAVLAGTRVLLAEGRGGMLALPGDIPLVSVAEVEALLAAHGAAPCFSIVPAHDGKGSNAVALSPPDVVPLQFGGASYKPHVATAVRQGVRVVQLALPGIALDLDEPADVARFLAIGSPTRAHRLLATTPNRSTVALPNAKASKRVLF